jgi:hypothetical protein
MTFVGRKIDYKTKFFPSSVQTVEYHSWNELNNEKLARDFESAKFSTLYLNDCYDSNHFCIRFTSIIKETFNKNIPIRKRRIRTNNIQPWLNNDIKTLIRGRDLKYKQLLEAIKENVFIDFHRNHYKFIRNKVVSELKKAKKNYYNQLIATNSKNLRSFISKMMPIKKSTKSKAIHNLDLNYMNDFLATQPSKLLHEHMRTQEDRQNFSDLIPQSDISFEIPEIDELNATQIISNLANTESTGFDGVSSKMKMKKLSYNFILPHLKVLINLIMSTAVFPQIWKQ